MPQRQFRQFLANHPTNPERAIDQLSRSRTLANREVWESFSCLGNYPTDMLVLEINSEDGRSKAGALAQEIKEQLVPFDIENPPKADIEILFISSSDTNSSHVQLGIGYDSKDHRTVMRAVHDAIAVTAKDLEIPHTALLANRKPFLAEPVSLPSLFKNSMGHFRLDEKGFSPVDRLSQMVKQTQQEVGESGKDPGEVLKDKLVDAGWLVPAA